MINIRSPRAPPVITLASIGLCITRHSDKNDMLMTRAMRGVECSTYYMLSRSKARLCIRSAVWCTASVYVLDYEFLINQATKTILRHAIPTRLKKHHADEVEVEIS